MLGLEKLPNILERFPFNFVKPLHLLLMGNPVFSHSCFRIWHNEIGKWKNTNE
jgi:hypothetical protein